MLEKLSAIKAFMRPRLEGVELPFPSVTLFFSVSDGDTRARVVHVSDASLEAAWQKGIATLQALMDAEKLKGKWVRVDWVEAAETTTWQALRALLTKTKRNYFRYGLALDHEFRFAFLEQELNANAMLYGGNSAAHAMVNESNFLLYAKARHCDLAVPNFKDEEEVILLSTRGVFCNEKGQLFELNGSGLDAGRRVLASLTENDVFALVRDASNFLAEQVQDDGSFVYGYHPCFDRRIDAYNALRHASTTYSMIEAWEVTGNAALKEAIDRSLANLTGTLIRDVVLPDGSEAAFLVDVGNEIKLGGNAVSILALAKYAELTGSDAYHGVMERLALGIVHMQNPATGAFVHVLNYPGLDTKAAYRTIYYDGEAAFGLMRLYGLTGHQRWLACVEKAFGHFIASDHWKHHDHWLGYCVNELTRYRPEERYFRFGLRNVADYLGFVADRITTFPTLLELMMAVRETLSRIGDHPDLHHLFAEIDLPRFERALEKRAHYLLNGHFWPEMAMYHRKPDRIVGSFFIRHHSFRVRIDDVEHYLSGFVAYLKYLVLRAQFRELVKEHSLKSKKPNNLSSTHIWTAADVEAATGGTWVDHPPQGWSATGLSTFAPAMQPGNLVVVRTGEDKTGMLSQVVRRMQPPPAGIIAADPSQVQIPDVPVLLVSKPADAVLAMGHYARTQMTGKVLAVTGSAGKTTAVAMLSHVLSAWGPVRKSEHNANLPLGVAWNLASIPWDTPYMVMELAIGRMAVSARMARPHVAIFTNILPAHLGETSTITDIAKTKAAIFLGMSAEDTAVINRDMLEFETVIDAARKRGVGIVLYGTSNDCDVRLIGYDAHSHQVCASINGREIEYRVGAAGQHMALNSLAILAAVSALGNPLEPAIAQLDTFAALPGRGEEMQISLGDRRLTVIDDAYNANPGSMRAALDRLNQQQSGGRRIAVLGQMAELGPQAISYHTELAAVFASNAIDRVYVTGELYADFWKELPAARKGGYADSLAALKETLLDQLMDGDTVLFKGSNSTRIHELVAWIKESSARAA